MCGFAGILNSNKSIQRNHLKELAAKVSFRGPDSCGLRIFDSTLQNADEGEHALFFNRLAIVDIDHRSDQPFEDERYLLSFNGEIYNYQDIKKELEGNGILFHTTSDTEVLFYALREWQADALTKLNGMFAFFWLDKKERTFILARDRLGIKPVYYQQDRNTFTYGSELNSILRFSQKEPIISPEAVEMYLWMQFVPTPFTIIDGINKLPPGHFIQGNIDNVQKLIPKCYWDAYAYVSSQKQNSPDLETVLKNSLDRQLHADVPLGLFLSSGVDSSLLAALMNKYFAKDNDVNFYTVQFSEKTNSDESDDAKRFIQGFNNPRLHCNTIAIDPEMMLTHLNEQYDYYDEPFADPASLLNRMVSIKAREHVTVAISGDGADELFWGYSRYNRWQSFTKINNVPLLSGLGRSIGTALPSSVFADNIGFVLEKDPVKRHFNFFLPSGMRNRIRHHITRYPIWALDSVETIAHRNDLPAILDIKTYLADAMLYKVDRSSMAASLEVRVPYLDNEVLEYALSMPLSKKSTAEFQNKAPLKKLLVDLAPHYNISRPKKGFNFPLRKWLKENWKEQVLTSVNKQALQKAGLQPEPYIKLVHDFYASRNNYFTDVWYIFNLALWMEKFKAGR